MSHKLVRMFGCSIILFVVGCAQEQQGSRQFPMRGPGAAPGPGGGAGGMMMGGASSDSPLVGKKAPDLSLKDSEGKRVSLAKLLATGPVVVYFYKGVW